MSKIALIADDVNVNNGLQYTFNYLRDCGYDITKTEYEAVKSVKPDLVITNIANYLPELINNFPTIFILTNGSGEPLLGNTSYRRLLIGPLQKATAIIVPSTFAAKEIFDQYRIKPTIQLPFIPLQPIDYEPEYILHSGDLDQSIVSNLSRYKFKPYRQPKDFERAFVYVDAIKSYECFNKRLCIASSYGIPTVAENIGSNLELAGDGDILVYPNAPKQKWVDAIKTSLRDRSINRQKNKKSSLRFQYMHDLEGEINKVVKNENKDTSKLPQIAARLQQQKAEDKIKRMNRAKIKQGSAVRIRTTMGRRETLAERERRRKRFAVKQSEAQHNAGKSPVYSIIDTPTWFTSSGECDVSIIVPMYKSRSVIEKQIADWDLLDDGLKKEIIYVDDNCPHASHEIVIPSWEKRRTDLNGETVGKLICSDINRGYGPNCNLGARHAEGKYLIFLNADVYVLPNWVKPMYELMEDDPDIGIVGNLQIQTRGNKGLIDSAGSQWEWAGGHFEHIGRTILDGTRLGSAIRYEEMPVPYQKPRQCEMVTGCCFMIPKFLFEEIEGYDEVYKIGYWEDSDMNMAVTEKGYKIYLQPESQVLHVGGHTKAGGHKFMKQNRKRFFDRWVRTGFVDKVAAKPRPANKSKPDFTTNIRSVVSGDVIGCIIACNEEEFLDVSVRSIAPLVDKFIFVIGGNQYAYQSGMCDEKGYPKDDTLEIAKALSQEFNGEVIEPPGRLWKGKTEQRNAYARLMQPNQWMFMLDGDEVYKQGALWCLAHMMRSYECFLLQYYVFWNNIDTIGLGAWENYPQERIVKWKEGYQYRNPNHLSLVDQHNKQVSYRVPTYNQKDKWFYHYSWVRPLEKIQQKLAYYENQIQQEWKKKNPVVKNYFRDIFIQWRKDPQSVQFTHPRGGGEVAPFAGIHPWGITKLIQEGKLDF